MRSRVAEAVGEGEKKLKDRNPKTFRYIGKQFGPKIPQRSTSKQADPLKSDMA